ncbi:hypothetical protein K438DRAFT_1982436 [Mycena galopus ATCC 62051]|nr:hypothetical protein K438DRAFT_1982436 [Mycena galopus ATCC 62051]
MLQAVKHVKHHLNSIKRVYHLENLDSVSSVNSTLSSVRGSFAQESADIELGKLFARPNYRLLVEDPDVRTRLIAKSAYGTCTQFYRDRATGEAIAIPAQSILFEFNAVNSGKAVVPEGMHPAIHFAHIPSLLVPPLLSTAGQGAVNSLLGVRSLPVRWSNSTSAVNSGALSVRAIPFSEGASLWEVRNALAESNPPAPVNSTIKQSYISAVLPAPSHPTAVNIVPSLLANTIPLLASHWTSYNFRNLPANARSITSNGGTITENRNNPSLDTVEDLPPTYHQMVGVEGLLTEVEEDSQQMGLMEAGDLQVGMAEAEEVAGLPSTRRKVGQEVMVEAQAEAEVEVYPAAGDLPSDWEEAEVEGRLVAEALPLFPREAASIGK